MEETRKIQGTQFDKIIRGIVEAKLYGYTLLEIMPGIDSRTGKLAEVNIVERRNVLPEQHTVVKRQGIWLPNWNLDSRTYRRNYILINSGDLGLFSATTPLILAKEVHGSQLCEFQPYVRPAHHRGKERVREQHRQGKDWRMK